MTQRREFHYKESLFFVEVEAMNYGVRKRRIPTKPE